MHEGALRIKLDWRKSKCETNSQPWQSLTGANLYKSQHKLHAANTEIPIILGDLPCCKTEKIYEYRDTDFGLVSEISFGSFSKYGLASTITSWSAVISDRPANIFL